MAEGEVESWSDAPGEGERADSVPEGGGCGLFARASVGVATGAWLCLGAAVSQKLLPLREVVISAENFLH